MKEIDRITMHTLKDVFGGEATGFTPWLSKHLGILSEKLNINITCPDREHKLETMKVDIVAKAGDDGEKDVIIENQFGDSDSDHLGKVITYAAHQRADYAVWIVEKARNEHISAIQMLNDSSIACNFYFIEATAVSIGNSKPAILFDVVCAPVVEKGKPAQKSATEQRLINFWTNLCEYANKNGVQLSRMPQSYHWLTISTGTSKVHFDMFIRKGSVSVRLLLDSSDQNENKRHFHLIEKSKDVIDEQFNQPLQWQLAEDNKASVIMLTNYDNGGYEQENWLPIFEWLCNTYIQMSKVFAPYIEKIKSEA